MDLGVRTLAFVEEAALENARDPAPQPPWRHDASRRVVQDASIAHPGPALRHGVEAPPRIHAVLKGHGSGSVPQEASELGHELALVPDPQVSSLLVADEPRSRNVLGAVARARGGSIQAVGHAHDQGGSGDPLQVVPGQGREHGGVVEQPQPAPAHGQDAVQDALEALRSVEIITAAYRSSREGCREILLDKSAQLAF